MSQALNMSAVNRKKDVKKGIDLEEARRKREENIIELRKTKRDENLQKKRSTFATPNYGIEDSNKATSGQRVRMLVPAKRKSPSFDLTEAPCCALQLEELPMMVNGVFSGGLQEQYEATQKFRKLLSIGKACQLLATYSIPRGRLLTGGYCVDLQSATPLLRR